MIYFPSKIYFNTAVKQIRAMADSGVYDQTLQTLDYYFSCIFYLESHEAFIHFIKCTELKGTYKYYLLSLSFRQAESDTRLPFSHKRSIKLLNALFGDQIDKVFCQPPLAPEVDIWHFKLYCSDDWKPIPDYPKVQDNWMNYQYYENYGFD